MPAKNAVSSKVPLGSLVPGLRWMTPPAGSLLLAS